MSGTSDVSEYNLLKLENQLCFMLYSASRKMTSAYRPLLNELGVTYPQYLVMMVLWDTSNQGAGMERGVKVGDLSSKLMLDNGTLTPLLKRMEQQGLLTRGRDPSDERVVRICLTSEGAALESKAMSIPEKMLCDSGLGLEDVMKIRSELSEVLSKVPGLTPQGKS